MRIPLWLAIPLCMLFVGMLWWARIRNQGLNKLDVIPVATRPVEPVTPPVIAEPVETPPRAVVIEIPQPVEPVVELPKIPLTGLGISPALNEYAEHAALGADAMIQLATALEAGGHFQRALLAWERVLDSMEAGESQRATACQAIARLRPTLPDWNADPQSILPLVLNVSTDSSNKPLLDPLIVELPKIIAAASSAVVGLSVKVEYAKTKRPNPAVPAGIAIWFTPAGKNAPTTEVATFTPHPATAETLRSELLRAVFNVVAANVGKSASPAIAPRVPAAEAKPVEDLTHQITRLQWQAFATSLTKPAAN